MGAVHTAWMEEGKVRLVLWGITYKIGWKRERYGWLNGWKRESYGWLNEDHAHNMVGREKGTAG